MPTLIEAVSGAEVIDTVTNSHNEVCNIYQNDEEEIVFSVWQFKDNSYGIAVQYFVHNPINNEFPKETIVDALKNDFLGWSGDIVDHARSIEDGTLRSA